MAKLLILGAGTAGTMTANLLRKALDASWSITVVDQDTEHHYQPGYLFIPFWMEPERVVKDRRGFLPDGVEFVEAAIERVDPHAQQVHLAGDRTLAYDWLVIATGTRPDPTLVEGMAEALAEHTTVHQFFTLEGATALKAALASFDSGRLLVHVARLDLEQVHLRPAQGEQPRRGRRVQQLALVDGHLAGLVAHVVAGHAPGQRVGGHGAGFDRDGFHDALAVDGRRHGIVLIWGGAAPLLPQAPPPH